MPKKIPIDKNLAFSKKKLSKKRANFLPIEQPKSSNIWIKISVAVLLLLIGGLSAYYLDLTGAIASDNKTKKIATNKVVPNTTPTPLTRPNPTPKVIPETKSGEELREEKKKEKGTEDKQKDQKDKNKEDTTTKPPQKTTSKPKTKTENNEPTYPYHVNSPYRIYNDTNGPTTIYAGPSSSSAKKGTIYNGTEILILCQTRGNTVSNSHGESSNLWNKIGHNQFVPDMHTYTGHDSYVTKKCQ
ncbi:hypothetical protein SAMN05444392_1211 [Seinonella peptonophila]|uniref:SH3 domain-containing protein n=1 Tax=Seinonella peptonophila TaxID=112248 RepID=A0A1M5BC69_9BACL|nr:hypothetical protein [Seinonella peptonophila]SHF39976.1 hypothetical protein SAMN05444392_1211 [Seinonella peptonophila]